MAVAAVVRTTPGGTMLKDGYSTKVGFENDLNVEFWEKTVSPSGYDGGDKIDITTMWNATVRTHAARSLYDATDGSITVAYDPIAITSIKALINVEGIITYTFPDGTTDSRYGYLKSFEPQELSEGSHPEASISIAHTNRHNTTDAEEAGTIVDGS
tara:strand:+ start:809 stop:1276 length:468 start_codon:yes stop_codon:yes gene_type:complete